MKSIDCLNNEQSLTANAENSNNMPVKNNQLTPCNSVTPSQIRTDLCEHIEETTRMPTQTIINAIMHTNSQTDIHPLTGNNLCENNAEFLEIPIQTIETAISHTSSLIQSYPQITNILCEENYDSMVIPTCPVENAILQIDLHNQTFSKIGPDIHCVEEVSTGTIENVMLQDDSHNQQYPHLIGNKLCEYNYESILMPTQTIESEILKIDSQTYSPSQVDTKMCDKTMEMAVSDQTIENVTSHGNSQMELYPQIEKKFWDNYEKSNILMPTQTIINAPSQNDLGTQTPSLNGSLQEDNDKSMVKPTQASENAVSQTDSQTQTSLSNGNHSLSSPLSDLFEDNDPPSKKIKLFIRQKSFPCTQNISKTTFCSNTISRVISYSQNDCRDAFQRFSEISFKNSLLGTSSQTAPTCDDDKNFEEQVNEKVCDSPTSIIHTKSMNSSHDASTQTEMCDYFDLLEESCVCKSERIVEKRSLQALCLESTRTYQAKLNLPPLLIGNNSQNIHSDTEIKQPIENTKGTPYEYDGFLRPEKSVEKQKCDFYDEESDMVMEEEDLDMFPAELSQGEMDCAVGLAENCDQIVPTSVVPKAATIEQCLEDQMPEKLVSKCNFDWKNEQVNPSKVSANVSTNRPATGLQCRLRLGLSKRAKTKNSLHRKQ